MQVVTAFIQRPSDDNVLAVLRSDKVGTYQRYWGAVSGGVEQGDRSLADRCCQEVRPSRGMRAQGCPGSTAWCAKPGALSGLCPAFILQNFRSTLAEPCRNLQIWEEVGFAADQVQLVRSGRPLIVDDGEALLHRKLWAPHWLPQSVNSQHLTLDVPRGSKPDIHSYLAVCSCCERRPAALQHSPVLVPAQPGVGEVAVRRALIIWLWSLGGAAGFVVVHC